MPSCSIRLSIQGKHLDSCCRFIKYNPVCLPLKKMWLFLLASRLSFLGYWWQPKKFSLFFFITTPSWCIRRVSGLFNHLAWQVIMWYSEQETMVIEADNKEPKPWNLFCSRVGCCCWLRWVSWSVCVCKWERESIDRSTHQAASLCLLSSVDLQLSCFSFENVQHFNNQKASWCCCEHVNSMKEMRTLSKDLS